MIKTHKAPAGWIAHFESDTINPKWKSEDYLGVTGKWCDSENEAIASVIVAREKHLKKLEEKRRKFNEKIDAEINILISASSTNNKREKK